MSLEQLHRLIWTLPAVDHVLLLVCSIGLVAVGVAWFWLLDQ